MAASDADSDQSDQCESDVSSRSACYANMKYPLWQFYQRTMQYMSSTTVWRRHVAHKPRSLHAHRSEFLCTS